MAMKKRTSQRRHAARRAMERFGIQLSRHDQEMICQMIRANAATFVQKQSHRISVFDVQYEGETLRVVYDRQRSSLATVLRPEMTPVPLENIDAT